MIKVKESHYGPWTTAYCDSCGAKMFECAEIHWEEGQELVYSPLLCENCGQKHNKDVGENVKKIEELEKKVRLLPQK